MKALRLALGAMAESYDPIGAAALLLVADTLSTPNPSEEP
jgi:hypothetical protein